ncbi:hypothetical protein ACMXYW_01050 [Neptuniibacter sp. QD48_55]|uniref:hypothetical protein n=1 Tax=Neptuniibacter sp. QD48_55 TaxID=3398212 RepID=UPI0039F44E1E
MNSKDTAQLEVNQTQKAITMLSKVGHTQQKLYYCKLLEGWSLEDKKNLFQTCMDNKNLVQHASKIQSTYFEGVIGGFHENIGGNGAMGKGGATQ